MKSDAERKRDERQRMRDRGYVLKQVWIHPDDKGANKKLAELKRIERFWKRVEQRKGET